MFFNFKERSYRTFHSVNSTVPVSISVVRIGKVAERICENASLITIQSFCICNLHINGGLLKQSERHHVFNIGKTIFDIDNIFHRLALIIDVLNTNLFNRGYIRLIVKVVDGHSAVFLFRHFRSLRFDTLSNTKFTILINPNSINARLINGGVESDIRVGIRVARNSICAKFRCLHTEIKAVTELVARTSGHRTVHRNSGVQVGIEGGKLRILGEIIPVIIIDVRTSTKSTNACTMLVVHIFDCIGLCLVSIGRSSQSLEAGERTLAIEVVGLSIVKNKAVCNIIAVSIKHTVDMENIFIGKLNLISFSRNRNRLRFHSSQGLCAKGRNAVCVCNVTFIVDNSATNCISNTLLEHRTINKFLNGYSICGLFPFNAHRLNADMLSIFIMDIEEFIKLVSLFRIPVQSKRNGGCILFHRLLVGLCELIHKRVGHRIGVIHFRSHHQIARGVNLRCVRSVNDSTIIFICIEIHKTSVASGLEGTSSRELTENILNVCKVDAENTAILFNASHATSAKRSTKTILSRHNIHNVKSKKIRETLCFQRPEIKIDVACIRFVLGISVDILRNVNRISFLSERSSRLLYKKVLRDKSRNAVAVDIARTRLNANAIILRGRTSQLLFCQLFSGHVIVELDFPRLCRVRAGFFISSTSKHIHQGRICIIVLFLNKDIALDNNAGNKFLLCVICALSKLINFSTRKGFQFSKNLIAVSTRSFVVIHTSGRVVQVGVCISSHHTTLDAKSDMVFSIHISRDRNTDIFLRNIDEKSINKDVTFRTGSNKAIIDSSSSKASLQLVVLSNKGFFINRFALSIYQNITTHVREGKIPIFANFIKIGNLNRLSRRLTIENKVL